MVQNHHLPGPMCRGCMILHVVRGCLVVPTELCSYFKKSEPDAPCTVLGFQAHGSWGDNGWWSNRWHNDVTCTHARIMNYDC